MGLLKHSRENPDLVRIIGFSDNIPVYTTTTEEPEKIISMLSVEPNLQIEIRRHENFFYKILPDSVAINFISHLTSYEFRLKYFIDTANNMIWSSNSKDIEGCSSYNINYILNEATLLLISYRGRFKDYFTRALERLHGEEKFSSL